MAQKPYYRDRTRFIFGVILFLVLVVVLRVRSIPFILVEIAVTFSVTYLVFWLLERRRR